MTQDQSNEFSLHLTQLVDSIRADPTHTAQQIRMVEAAEEELKEAAIATIPPSSLPDDQFNDPANRPRLPRTDGGPRS